jgi:hypothetical protein
MDKTTIRFRILTMTPSEFGTSRNDYGANSFVVPDHVATVVDTTSHQHFNTQTASQTCSLEVGDVRQIPSALFNSVNDTLVSSRQPSRTLEQDRCTLHRSLSCTVHSCPAEFVPNLFEIIQDGVSLWIAGSFNAFTGAEGHPHRLFRSSRSPS